MYAVGTQADLGSNMSVNIILAKLHLSLFHHGEIVFYLALSFFWTLVYYFGEIWGHLKSFFSCPDVEKSVYDPAQPSGSKKDLHSSALDMLDFPLALIFSFPGFTKWIVDVHLCHTSHYLLFWKGAVCQFLPLARLLRVRLETPCSGLVWWACCVFKCSLKAQIEDTKGIWLISASS